MYMLVYEDKNYNAKWPGKKIFTSKLTKGISNEKKFKGKPDLRNSNSKGTNGMHQTKEHQMMPR